MIRKGYEDKFLTKPGDGTVREATKEELEELKRRSGKAAEVPPTKPEKPK